MPFNFLKFLKPITFEFNSWCCSFRLAYGDEGPSHPNPKEKHPAIGFGMDNPEPAQDEDEDD